MPMPDMKPVAKSSNIKSIGYDDKTSMLYVDFLSGLSYSYADVPRDVWEALESSNSKGSFLHVNIKGKYAADRLDTKPKAE